MSVEQQVNDRLAQAADEASRLPPDDNPEERRRDKAMTMMHRALIDTVRLLAREIDALRAE